MSVYDTEGSNSFKLYRGVDMGGGVGGLLYSCKTDGSSFNYKGCNIVGSIMSLYDSDGLNSASIPTFGFGESFNVQYISINESDIDKYRANTKRKEGDLINDGHRWRSATLGLYLTPDPMEYIDGPNCYIYCNQNPWSKFDPEGLWGNLQPGSDFAKEFDQKKSENLKPVEEALTKVGTAAAAVANVASGGALEAADRAIAGEKAAANNADFQKANTAVEMASMLVGGAGVLKAVAKGGLKVAEKVAGKIEKSLGKEESVSLYRVFGGDSKPLGHSWTSVDPNSVKTSTFLLMVIRGGISEYIVKDPSKVELKRVSGANPEF